MIFADRLRPPSRHAPLASAYKDWLHVNLFDPVADVSMILNASLHGSPHDDRSVASATVISRVGGDWGYDTGVVEQSAATVDDRSLRVGALSMAIDPVDGGIGLDYHHEGSDTTLRVDARPLAADIGPPAPVTFGSGWIGWRAVPLLTATGDITIRGRRLAPSDALVYHDHNWGRWYWGDDIGWEWGSLVATDGCLVVSRATDRGHRAGEANVTVSLPVGDRWRNWSYRGPTVDVELSDWRVGSRRRLPGAMAALHTGRMRPRLPRSVRIVVDDGFDRVVARLRLDDAVQVITAEPHRPGYNFIHELFGRFEAEGTSGGHRFATAGEAVFEYVD